MPNIKIFIGDRYRDENGVFRQIKIDMNRKFLYADDSDFELSLDEFLKKYKNSNAGDYYQQRWLRGLE